MDTFEQRLESFKFWHLNKNPLLNASRLALLGFYYTGYKDKIACFTCKLELHSFIGNEDVVHDHKRYSPHCPFMLVGSVVNYVNTSCTVLNIITSPYSIDIPDIYTDVTLIEGRLKTYTNWPNVLQHLVFPLCLAGFYYTNVGDSVCCYVCGRIVNNWQITDIDVQTHKAHFEHCALNRNRSATLTNLSSSSSSTNVRDKRTKQHDALPASAPDQTNVENTPAYYELPRCLLCRSSYINTTLLPCYHFCACSECGPVCVQCPACNVHCTGLFYVNVPHEKLRVIKHENADEYHHYISSQTASFGSLT
ncbi:iap-5 [Hyphantria cunea granulovirus]|uniref:Iap-5 n=1 Tax=Hyphantria cunea granulovirus TaxID=307448 RepID=A0AAF1D2A4_9BBAC|nr:iap-5 [Hyphantria cunea granulovirus]QBQ01655.1 iap-5 [Hyphantria cunea granulovirus]